MNKVLLKLNYLSVFFFIFLIFISALFYTGGTPFHPDKHYYSFTHNFLSDLGRAETFTQTPNLPSRVLFMASMAVIALGLTSLSVTVFNSVRLVGKGRTIRIYALACGIVSSFFLASAGLAPWDRMFWVHVWSVNAAFIFMVLFVLFLSVIQVINEMPKRLYLVNIFAGLVIIMQGVILLIGPHYRTREGLPVQVIAQKIVVIILLVNLWVQAQGINKLYREKLL